MKSTGYKFASIVFLLVFLSSASIALMAEEVRFGVQAPRGALHTLKRWDNTRKYLEKQTGFKIKLVPLKPSVSIDAAKNNKVDILLLNPVVSAAIIENYKFKPVLTMSLKSGPQFGGVIIAHKDSGIKTAADLKGKNVMAYKFRSSAAAYVFQVKHLKDKGIDAHKDFKSFRQAKKQDDIVLAVKNKLVDAGFVKTGLLEGMAKEGRINMDDFVVIDKANDDYLYVHSTKLYPSWTLTHKSDMEQTQVEKIKQALKKLDANHVASKSGKYTGFVDAISLSDLNETLKALKLAPFDK